MPSLDSSKDSNEKSLDNLKKDKYTGTLTPSARKRMMIALDNICLMTPKRRIFNPVSKCHHDFHLSFVTLTISSKENVDYKTSMEMLEKFTRWLRLSKSCQSYVWRLELQKRGMIHFHIAVDQFIHHSHVRAKWNDIQSKHGLILKGMNPNSTDIHSTLDIENMSSYMAKYMAKEDNNVPLMNELGIKKVWGCSENLQGLPRPTIEIYPETRRGADIMDFLQVSVKDPFFASDYCVYYSGYSAGYTSGFGLKMLDKFGYRPEFIKLARSVVPRFYPANLFD